MLSIITGTPGAGKTNFALDRAVSMCLKENRSLYVHGVRGLDLDKIPCDAHVLENPELWFELPQGAVILLDEAQQVFRAQPLGAPVPPYVAALETHRHNAHDLFLTTQDPGILSHHVRRLAGRHYHLRSLPVGGRTTLYEYDTVQKSPQEWRTKQAALSVGVHKRRRECFDWYESTVEITSGHKARIPKGAWKIALPVLMLPIPLYMLFGTDNSMLGNVLGASSEPPSQAVYQDPAAPVPPGSQPAQSRRIVPGQLPGGLASPNLSVPSSSSSDNLSYSLAMLPEIPSLPFTAPVYRDLVLDAQDFPRPNCVILHDPDGGISDCRCWTQQATRFRTDLPTCIGFVKHGFFDPTRARARAGEAGYASDRERFSR